ncbi:hypothetical protein [Granulicella tundricola]|nr:hypothetical protein [Granulicella tundricola]
MQVIVVIRAQHQDQRDGGDSDLADRSDEEWFGTLFQQVLEAGA